MSKSISPIKTHRFSKGKLLPEDDLIVVEEPLEIRIGFGEVDNREETTSGLRPEIKHRIPAGSLDCIQFTKECIYKVRQTCFDLKMALDRHDRSEGKKLQLGPCIYFLCGRRSDESASVSTLENGQVDALQSWSRKGVHGGRCSRVLGSLCFG